MEDAFCGAICGIGVDKAVEAIGYVWKYHDLVESLETDLNSLDARHSTVKTDVDYYKKQRRVIRNDVKLWIEVVGKLLNEAKEFLETTQKKATGCCGRDCNWGTRYEDAKMAESLAEEIGKQTVDGGKFNKVYFMHLDPEPMAGFWADGYVALPSRDETIEQLKSFLRVKGRDAKFVLGIYGAKGVGKTRVAKKFAADIESAGGVKVVVADGNDDRKNIQSQIAERVGFEFTTESVTERALSLHTTLSAMKVLIILDNLDRKIDLSVIGIPQPKATNGCRILVVSTTSEACESMDSKKNLEIKPLDQKESQTLAAEFAIKEWSDYSEAYISSEKAWLPAEIEQRIVRQTTLTTEPDKKVAVSASGLGRSFEPGSHTRFNDLRPNPMAKIWAYGYVALPSMEETIEQLKCFLRPGGMDDKLIVGIYGVEGVGKTTLAMKFAADMETAGEVKVVVVNGNDDRRNILSHIAERIGFEFTTEYLPYLVSSLYKALSTMKVLIIFDDVDKKIDLLHIGIPYPMSNNNCRILVVSTTSKPCEAMLSTKNLEIKPLNQQESKTFAAGFAIKHKRSEYSASSYLSSNEAWLPAEIERRIYGPEDDFFSRFA